MGSRVVEAEHGRVAGLPATVPTPAAPSAPDCPRISQDDPRKSVEILLWNGSEEFLDSDCSVAGGHEVSILFYDFRHARKGIAILGTPSNNVMQLTKGGWMRMGASSSARVILNHGKVVRPSQLITSVGPTIPCAQPHDVRRYRCRAKLTVAAD